jgi:NOL1/NOP2/sun family putative RNA methylase
LKVLYDTKRYRSVLKTFSVKKPTTFRVNTIKSSREEIIHQLRNNRISYETVPWYNDAFITFEPKISLMDLDIYKTGSVYIQSLSSMIPALILDPQYGERICDLAAAPGSKTTQIATMMGNTGEIIANDNSHIRIYKLEANIKLLGIVNTFVKFGAGQTLWQRYPEYFDRTLVDVPCSMEGRFLITDPKTYGFWSIHKVKELTERQKWLLRSAVSATKVDGTIVYSTCTISPEENEGVIDWILKKEKGRVIVEDIGQTLPLDPAIASWNTRIYDPTIEKTRRIYPTDRMESFYIAKLRKIGSTIPSILRENKG